MCATNIASSTELPIAARNPQSLITGEQTPVTDGCTNRIAPRRFISAYTGSNSASAIERPRHEMFMLTPTHPS